MAFNTRDVAQLAIAVTLILIFLFGINVAN